MIAQEGDGVARLEALKRQVQIARAERAVAQIERHTKRLQESAILWDQANAYGDLIDRLKTADGQLLLAPSTVADRRHGANWPHWRTLAEHSILRAQSRFLAAVSDLAFGAISGLTSYVVGDGMTHLAVTKKGKHPPPSLLDAVNAEIDDFVLRNDLQGLEQENFKDSRVDGEAATRDFVDDEGRTSVRVILPEQILEDPREPIETGSFGVRNPPEDVQHATHYFVAYDGNTSDGEWVPAGEVTFLKVNVGRTIKRGMPDLVYDTHAGIKMAGRCVGNMVESAAIQAAISEIRQHDAATAAQVQEFVDAQEDFSLPELGTAKRTSNVRVTPGTVRDIPKGMNYVAPPFSQGGQTWIAIVQSALRKVGVRWNAPEWLTSGDASNNNYASSLTAEAPFHRRVLRWQGYYSRAFNARVRRAVKAAADAGRIRAEGKTWTWDEIRRVIDVNTEAPSVVSQDPMQQAQKNSIMSQAGVLSVQTWAQQEGLEYDQEQQNIEAHNERSGGAGGMTGGAMGGDPGAMGGYPGDASGAMGGAEDDPFADLDGADEEGGALGDATGDANNLRATVGGSQAIADLQRSVYAGELPREAAIANATIVFGFAPEEAEALFPQVAPTKTADDGDGVEGDDVSDTNIGDDEGIDLSEGYTGVKKDKLGRKRCYSDGKPAPCPDGQQPRQQPRRQQRQQHDRRDALVARLGAGKRLRPTDREHIAQHGLSPDHLKALAKDLPFAAKYAGMDPDDAKDAILRWHDGLEPSYLEGVGKDAPEQSRPQLRPPEAAAIKWYTGGEYKGINRKLRKGEPLGPRQEKHHKALQEAFSRIEPFEAPVMTHRGLSFANRDDMTSFVELCRQSETNRSALRMPGYTSTTRNDTVEAVDFQKDGEGHVQIHIAVWQGIDTRENSKWSEENELLLNHDSMIRVSHVEQIDGVTHVHAEQVLSAKQKPTLFESAAIDDEGHEGHEGHEGEKFSEVVAAGEASDYLVAVGAADDGDEGGSGSGDDVSDTNIGGDEEGIDLGDDSVDLSEGFSGRKQDKRGHTRCYSDGKPTPCHTQQHSGGQKDRHHQAAAERLKALMANPHRADAKAIAGAARSISKLTVAEAKALRRELGLEGGGKNKRRGAKAIAQAAARVIDERGQWERKARAAGVNPKRMFAEAEQIAGGEKQHAEEVRAMLADARGIYRSETGKELTALHKAFRGGDYTDIPGFERIARSVAGRYPGMLGAEGSYDGGNDSTSAAEKLYEYMHKGVPKVRLADAYQKAIDSISRGHEEVPF